MHLYSPLTGLLASAVVLAQPAIAPTAEQNKSNRSAAELSDEQAIRRAGAAYREAFARGDIDVVASFWTPDADFVDQFGGAYQVHAGLVRAKRLSQEGGQIPQPSRKTETLSIRFVTPDVAIEDGAFERTGAEVDESPQGRYTAVWVKREGKWLIDGVRELPVRARGASDPLAGLEWMIGDWEAEGAEARANVSCTWGPNKGYVLRQIDLEPKGAESVSATQWIGWDPIRQRIRSFLFDSRGGYSEGLWTNEGDAWVVHTKGVLREGKQSSATNFYSRIDDNTFMVESIDEEVDGQPGPDMRLRATRKPPLK